MRITRIKGPMLQLLQSKLQYEITKAGYISDVTIMNTSRIDIGLHMCSFRVNTKVHGYNARYNPHMTYKAGYKRTSTPTWEQRVDFNNIVNAVLNKYKVSCNVTSGDFIIRQGTKVFTEYDWENQKPDYMHQNEMRGYRVEKLETKTDVFNNSMRQVIGD